MIITLKLTSLLIFQHNSLADDPTTRSTWLLSWRSGGADHQLSASWPSEYLPKFVQRRYIVGYLHNQSVAESTRVQPVEYRLLSSSVLFQAQARHIAYSLPRRSKVMNWPNSKYARLFFLLTPYYHLGHPLAAMSKTAATNSGMSRRESELLNVREERKENAFPFSLWVLPITPWGRSQTSVP